jgi:hypothetical protein
MHAAWSRKRRQRAIAHDCAAESISCTADHTMRPPPEPRRPPAINQQMHARFLAVAQDPRIIPGVHHHCDEWCTYCPLTSRCLGFRCTVEWQKHHGRPANTPMSDVHEAVVFTRTLAAVEGVSTEEIDTILAHPDGESGLGTSDPLAAMTWDYSVGAAILMLPVSRRLVDTSPEPGGPAPEAVILWYHLRLYFRIVRALVARERHAAGTGGRLEDAIGSAKLALVSIARSRQALRSLGPPFDPAHTAVLIDLLDLVERTVDDRFPDARTFVRLGLDVPVA